MSHSIHPVSSNSGMLYLGHSVSDFAPTPDLKNLQRVLDRLIGLVGGLTLPEKRVRILDLACGICEEAFTLSAWLSNLDQPLEPREVSFCGFDIREQDLIVARDRSRGAELWFEEQKWRPPWLNCTFKKIDVSKPLPAELLETKQNVVFIRHQNTYHSTPIWTKIFENAFQSLTDEGYLIISSYFDREHQMAMELIKALGGQLLATLANPNSRPMKAKGKSVDRHVAVFSNRNEQPAFKTV